MATRAERARRRRCQTRPSLGEIASAKRRGNARDAVLRDAGGEHISHTRISLGLGLLVAFRTFGRRDHRGEVLLVGCSLLSGCGCERSLTALPGLVVLAVGEPRAGQRVEVLEPRGSLRRLVDRGILVKSFAAAVGPLEGCLRVSVGTPVENDTFVGAITAVLEQDD